jgi:deoxyribonuclease-1
MNKFLILVVTLASSITLILEYANKDEIVHNNNNISKFKVNNKEYKRTFQRSKIILEHTIYINHLYSFYSNCKLTYINNDLQPNLKNCNKFTHRKNKKANGLDWEHVQPASRLGKQRNCWNLAKKKHKSPRVYCAKVDLLYREYETDLHNLVPSVAEINRDRSDFKFANIYGNNNIYGNIDFSINFKTRRIEPRNSIKGDVARISLYMNDKYKLGFSNSEINMYNKWSILDPISSWEKLKNDMVFNIQGNRNKFIN